MRLLVIGGSWFVGRALVGDAARRGHDVTVFNRSGLAVPLRGTTYISGDRTDLQALLHLAASGPWDAVMDVPGIIPAHVRDAARILRQRTGQYVFISTVSAYREWPMRSVSEEDPRCDGDPDSDPGEWSWDEKLYRSMKVGCEIALAREYAPERLLILRPTIILGPHEYSARLTWWLSRANRGGRILAPGDPARCLQPIDVRDLATFTLDLVERQAHGTFNLTAPPGHARFVDLLEACIDVTNSKGEVTWVDPEWLAAKGVREWTELPLWRTAPGTWCVSTARAQAEGLTCRPLEVTVAETWDWMAGGGVPVPHERQSRHGIDPDKEARILAHWEAYARRLDDRWD
jgi:2'-hydroxyisoflavone reductase